MDRVALGILTEFLINLAAGWFGAAIVLPIRSEKRKIKFLLLTVNLSCGILSLVIAYIIRRTL
ncbi:MAG: hypothetical protein AAB583_05770 [Patescibacteria group bacterium]